MQCHRTLLEQVVLDVQHPHRPRRRRPRGGPAQRPRPPIIIGGSGKRRTPELTARYAAEFNMPFASQEATREHFARVREACEAVDRDPDGLTWSNALTVCVGKDEAELRRRAEATGRELEELRENGIAGTPAEAVQRIGEFQEIGSQRIYLQVLDVDDLDHLELIAAEVAPQV